MKEGEVKNIFLLSHLDPIRKSGSSLAACYTLYSPLLSMGETVSMGKGRLERTGAAEIRPGYM